MQKYVVQWHPHPCADACIRARADLCIEMPIWLRRCVHMCLSRCCQSVCSCTCPYTYISVHMSIHISTLVLCVEPSVHAHVYTHVQSQVHAHLCRRCHGVVPRYIGHAVHATEAIVHRNPFRSLCTSRRCGSRLGRRCGSRTRS